MFLLPFSWYFIFGCLFLVFYVRVVYFLLFYFGCLFPGIPCSCYLFPVILFWLSISWYCKCLLYISFYSIFVVSFLVKQVLSPSFSPQSPFLLPSLPISLSIYLSIYLSISIFGTSPLSGFRKKAVGRDCCKKSSPHLIYLFLMSPTYNAKKL